MNGVQVNVNDLTEVRRRHVKHRDAFDDAGIVDENAKGPDQRRYPPRPSAVTAASSVTSQR